jgi:Na+-transporting methylmalonyl-CoA/oxaloacetate decarboxylase gamma subunit
MDDKTVFMIIGGVVFVIILIIILVVMLSSSSDEESVDLEQEEEPEEESDEESNNNIVVKPVVVSKVTSQPTKDCGTKECSTKCKKPDVKFKNKCSKRGNYKKCKRSKADSAKTGRRCFYKPNPKNCACDL